MIKHSTFKRKRYMYIKRKLAPGQVILIGFLLLVFAGAVLLTLPISSVDRTTTPFVDSLFTATSATCVTGLIVVDTGVHWSLFGQIVIITLIQIGGLGFMSLGVMLSIFIKRRIQPRERVVIAESLGLSEFGGLVRFVKRILCGTFLVEGVGAVILASRFIPLFGWARGIWYGIFHSISSFCNAGFDILGFYGGEFSSLTAFAHDPVITITIASLIAIGGLGFIVWREIFDRILHGKRMSLYARIVVVFTLILIFGGALVIACFDWNNPQTLGSMPTGRKILQAIFQSVTCRTAGVDMIGNAGMTDASKLMSMLLMFVGGASGSTAGGVKVGTVAVILFAIFTFANGKKEVVISKRKIPRETVIRALSVMGIDFIAVLVSTFILMANSHTTLMTSMYESISAIATVGLTLSITPTLAVLSKLSIITLMFFGRVGILTITYSIMLRQTQKQSCITYPNTRFMIG